MRKVGFDVLKRQKKTLKFLLSYFLMKSGLCKFFYINYSEYRLYFHKNNYSRGFWVEKYSRKGDFNVFSKVLKENDTVVDVGANVGILTYCRLPLIRTIEK